MSDVQHRYQAIPYGWREIDIAALVARLIAQNKVTIKYGGQNIEKTDRKLVDLLRKRSETEKAVVARRVVPSEALMTKSTSFLREYLGTMDIPQDEDDLVAFVKSTFESKRDHYQKMLDQYADHAYPEKDLLMQARDLVSDVLSQAGDNVALLNRIVQRQDDLLDMDEDLENLEQFFTSQRNVFDHAASELQTLDKERDYLIGVSEMAQALNSIGDIMQMEKPYTRIGELPNLVQQLKQGHDTLLTEKKAQVLADIDQCENDVLQFAAECDYEGDIINKAKGYYLLKRGEVKRNTSLLELDAFITQIQKNRDSYYQAVFAALAASAEPPVMSNGGDKVAEAAPPAPKITTVAREGLCPVKRLTSKNDIDTYVESIRAKLYHAIEQGDIVQIG
ncbi:MAG: hypothetical protein UDB11_05875 [Peptococcaceae bacterium]|nr:hypothetical protein [Peptococcaceae bacterium]